MSLRTRLALGVTALTLVTLSVGGVWARQSAAQELERGIDDFLIERSESFTGPDAPTITDHIELLSDSSGQVRLLFTQSDAITQLVTPDGQIVGPPDQVRLPFDQDDLAAISGSEPIITPATVDGVQFRVLTAPVPGGGLVQIGRDLSEANAVLANLTLRLAIGGLVTSVVLAATAWLLVRRSLRPLEAITDATEELARTTHLHRPLPTGGNDEIGRLARSFNTMTDALADSRRRQQQLIEDAGHELRTPLSSLLTSVEVLAHGDAVPEPRRAQLLANAAQESRELTKLVNELIELAADPGQPAQQHTARVALAEIAGDIAESSRRRYHHPIVLDTSGGGQPVDIDVDLVSRAIANLVDNAAKFSDADQPIEIAADTTTIEVRDRGGGLATDDIDRIFDRFYRSATARNLPGSGLGLAIVKQAAESHGGRVWALNRPGGGAAVGFTIGPEEPPGAR